MKGKKLAVILTASALTAAMASTAFAAPQSDEQLNGNNFQQRNESIGAAFSSGFGKLSDEIGQMINQKLDEIKGNGERPELPDGAEAPDFENGERPELPDGAEAPDFENGERPELPDGAEQGQMPENMNKNNRGPQGGMPGQAQNTNNRTAQNSTIA